MTIIKENPIPVNPNKILAKMINQGIEKTIEGGIEGINTVGKYIEDVSIPGLTEVPGKITFRPGDFPFQINFDPSLTEGTYVNDTGAESSLSYSISYADRLKLQNSVFGTAGTTTVEEAGIKVWSFEFFTTNYAVLNQEILTRFGEDENDALTAEEAFNAFFRFFTGELVS